MYNSPKKKKRNKSLNVNPIKMKANWVSDNHTTKPISTFLRLPKRLR
jgi:hypothetical protein